MGQSKNLKRSQNWENVKWWSKGRERLCKIRLLRWKPREGVCNKSHPQPNVSEKKQSLMRGWEGGTCSRERSDS